MSKPKRTTSLAAVRRRYQYLINTPLVSERRIQRFLEQYPILLPVSWPLENRVFSQFTLAGQKTPDFVFAREDSLGIRWHFIEIEKPWNRGFTNKGDPTAEMSHALRQIYDWHTFMIENRDYVLRHFRFKRQMNRLGLAEPEFTVILGRRDDLNDQTRALARRLSSHNLALMSFDRLINRLGSPLYDENEPLRSCRFANGKLIELASVGMKVTYTFH